MSKFRKQLRKWRGKRTQVEAAALIGVKVSTYRNWEHGRNEPRGYGMVKLMEVIK